MFFPFYSLGYFYSKPRSPLSIGSPASQFTFEWWWSLFCDQPGRLVHLLTSVWNDGMMMRLFLIWPVLCTTGPVDIFLGYTKVTRLDLKIWSPEIDIIFLFHIYWLSQCNTLFISKIKKGFKNFLFGSNLLRGGEAYNSRLHFYPIPRQHRSGQLQCCCFILIFDI